MFMIWEGGSIGGIPMDWGYGIMEGKYD